MQNCNPTTTPMDSSLHLSPASAEDHLSHSSFPYLEITGTLNYAAVQKRPDISHAVSTLSQFSSCFGAVHIVAVKHLLFYIKVTVDRGICFRAQSKPSRLLEAYVDADYANDLSTRKSTMGYVIKLGGCAVFWRTKKQSAVALSTTEAEYMAMAECSKHLVWFRRLIYILTQDPPQPTKIKLAATSLFNDNNRALFLSQEAAINARSKNTQIRNHYIRKLVRDNIIAPQQIDTK